MLGVGSCGKLEETRLCSITANRHDMALKPDALTKYDSFARRVGPIYMPFCPARPDHTHGHVGLIKNLNEEITVKSTFDIIRR